MENYNLNEKYMPVKYRNRVLKRFDNKCPISGHISDLGEACHILERKNSLDDFDKNDVFNGILLSTTLHKAFDKKYFTFDEITSKIKIINNYINLQDMGLINGKYIWQLDNEKSKYYLRLRNTIFT
jgi:predicted restriction endonuclease